MPIKRIKVSERQIERTCTAFLALDGWRALKTDPVSRREWGKGFGEKGMADCLYIRYELGDRLLDESDLDCYGISETTLYSFAEVLWIEWKRVGGKTATHQAQWHIAERARGALVWVAGQDFAPDFDSFVAFYRTSGLLRRPGL